MKSRTTMLLCTIVLLLRIAAPPALAAGGPYYPISVEEYTAGSLDEPRISRGSARSISSLWPTIRPASLRRTSCGTDGDTICWT